MCNICVWAVIETVIVNFLKKKIFAYFTVCTCVNDKVYLAN